MKEMKKDETIERAFREYFAGSEAPDCDLGQAKCALARPRSGKTRGIFRRIVPVFACFLLLCVASVGILLGREGDAPGDIPQGEAPTGAQYYTLASAQAEAATYAQLSQRYGAALRGLSPFEWADNAQAEYTLYAVEGEDALIGVRLRYLYGFLYWEGELYIDLTDGALLPEEVRAIAALESSGTLAGFPCAYATQYVDGEYVSDARLSLPAADCYMTVTGQSEEAVFCLLRLLAGNA